MTIEDRIAELLAQDVPGVSTLDLLREAEQELRRLRGALTVADEYFKGKRLPCPDINCSQPVCGWAATIRTALREP